MAESETYKLYTNKKSFCQHKAQHSLSSRELALPLRSIRAAPSDGRLIAKVTNVQMRDVTLQISGSTFTITYIVDAEVTEVQVIALMKGRPKFTVAEKFLLKLLLSRLLAKIWEVLS